MGAAPDRATPDTVAQADAVSARLVASVIAAVLAALLGSAYGIRSLPFEYLTCVLVVFWVVLTLPLLLASFHYEHLVPGRGWVPLSLAARRCTQVRCVVYLVIGVAAAFGSTWWVGWTPLVHGPLSVILREQGRERRRSEYASGGDSLVRTLSRWVTIYALGREDRGARVHDQLFGGLWVMAAACCSLYVFAALAGVLDDGVTLGEVVSRTYSNGSQIGPVQEEPAGSDGDAEADQSSPGPAGSDGDAGAVQSSPELAGSDGDEEKGSSLQAKCKGLVSLPALRGVSEPARARLERQWHRFGGFEIGCFEGDFELFGDGGVVLWLTGGVSDPAALVDHESGSTVLVRQDGEGLLRRLLGEQRLVAVDPLHVGVSSSFQIFHTVDGCHARIHTHNMGRIELSEPATAAVFTLIADLGGSLDRIVENKPEDRSVELDVTVDLADGRIHVLLADGPSVQVLAKPQGLHIELPSQDSGCPEGAIAQVRQAG